MLIRVAIVENSCTNKGERMIKILIAINLLLIVHHYQQMINQFPLESLNQLIVCTKFRVTFKNLNFIGFVVRE